jgi:hypothetical protein
LNEPYILISISIILSVGNFGLWWLLFDEDFTKRLEIYEVAHREQMKQENEEFMSKMQDVIELDPEAIEIAGFGEKWKEKLESVNKLKDEAQTMRRRTVWVYYSALAAIFFAAGGLALPGGVEVTTEFRLYFTAVSWWVLVTGVLILVGLLVHYQIIENKSEPRTEGEPIRDDSGLQSVTSGLRKKLPL